MKFFLFLTISLRSGVSILSSSSKKFRLPQPGILKALKEIRVSLQQLFHPLPTVLVVAPCVELVTLLQRIAFPAARSISVFLEDGLRQNDIANLGNSMLIASSYPNPGKIGNPLMRLGFIWASILG